MTTERIVRGAVGVLIVLAVLLSIYVSPNWLWLAGFFGVNLFQSAFTGFCPLEIVLKRLGVKTAVDVAKDNLKNQ